MAKVHVVTGPPAAGKSTFVRASSGAGDVVIDFDLLANALSGQPVDNHDHAQHIRQITKAARRAAIAKALEGEATVWIIHSMPGESSIARYREMGADIHRVDPGKDVVLRRCKMERPPEMLQAAAKWYADQERPKPRTTTEKGLGWQHQKTRDALLAVHQDGTPCWWCARPMFRDKHRNHDGLALAADHDQSRYHGGTKATRLLHGSCNSSRQAGDRDDQRPALNLLSTVASTSPPEPRTVPVEPITPPAPVFNWPEIK